MAKKSKDDPLYRTQKQKLNHLSLNDFIVLKSFLFLYFFIFKIHKI